MPASDSKSPAQPFLTSWFSEGYGRLLRFLSRRLGSHAEVEDLAQEVFLRMLRVDRVDLVRSPHAYLHQVAANVLVEWRLRARQQRPHSSDDIEELVAEDSPEQAAAAHLTNKQLNKALLELPPACQAVLILRAQEDLTNEQLAERLGITRRMVKRHLEMGYAFLRARLARAQVGKDVLS